MKKLFILLTLTSLLLAAYGGIPPSDIEATVQVAIAATQTAQPTDNRYCGHTNRAANRQACY
jgi:hypothetical protein